jgi:methylated-DNA-[protein]-cysteine S-methyltransferase
MRRREPVRFAFVEGPGGRGLVASRGKEVVASFLPARETGDLVARLRSRFPDAVEAAPRAVPGASALRRWLAGDPSALPGVRVDLGGVPDFSARVYRALRRVPPGATVTYGELARRAGSPAAVRAVGRAMASNPLAPFVPCHRVVGSGGSLTGYSAPGGIPLKGRLLRDEARWASGGGADRAKP